MSGYVIVTENILRAPDPAELVEFISNGHERGYLVTIHANCSVEFTGNREGEIGPGDRVILCKRDGAVAVHRPSGARAVARQGIRSSFEVFLESDVPVIYAAKGRNESIRVDIHEPVLVIQYVANDDAALVENRTEEQMHAYIESNPETIEDNLRIISHERGTPYGRIDFFAADSDGNNVVLEIKTAAAKYEDVDQLHRYVSHFQKTKESTIRGILVAPYIGEKIQNLLREHGLEWVRMEEYEKTHFAPGQTLIDEWE
jgi:RecB family endonuclease NucS